MSSIFQKKLSDYINHLLKLIKQHLPDDTKCKYSNKHKLQIIIYVLKTGICWSHLNNLTDDKFICNLANESTYRKFFYNLVKMNVFKIAFHNLLGKLFMLGLLKYDLISIDSTSIINKIGLNEYVDFGYLPKKHKSLKIHTAVDENQVPLGFEISKGSEHDINLAKPLVNKISKIIKLKDKKILVDKGYISKTLKEQLKNKYKVDFIYPNRINQPKNSPTEINLLKKRVKVEHSYATLKQFKRIDHVNERKIINYSSLIYLSLILIISTKFPSIL